MEDYVGKKCAECGNNIWATDEVMVCSCGTPYHKTCWDKIAACKRCSGSSADADAIFVSANKEQQINDLAAHETPLLFSNIGGKIKTLATVNALMGMFLGIIAAVCIGSMDEDFIFIGIVVAVIVGFVSWISSFVLYGFGDLIAMTQTNTNSLIRIMEKMKKDN